MANPPNRPMNTPPPPGFTPPKSAVAATPPPVRKSSGAVPSLKPGTRAMTRGPAAAGAVAAAPAGGGGSAGGGQGGAPAPRPVTIAKPSGMSIKSKIVVAMSLLSAGTAVLMFAIVNMITASSLQSTIEESGVGMLQEAEALHRNYKAGLNDRSLIAFFNQDANAAKFDEYWRGLQPRWGDPLVPISRNFYDWNQLAEDRLWVLLAKEFRTRGKENFRGNDAELEQAATELLGDEWGRIKNLKAGSPPYIAEVPRRANDRAGDAYRSSLGLLVKDLGLRPESTYRDLRNKVLQETLDILVDAGLRKVIQARYKEEFVRDLDQMTTAEGGQVRYLLFEMTGSATGSKFTTQELTVISPTPPQGREGVRLAPSGQVKRVGEVEVDGGVTIDGKAGFGFTKVTEGGDKVRIYLDGEKVKGRLSSLIMYLLIVAVVAVGLAIGVAFVIGQGITKPLQMLMQDIQIISGGNFDHRPVARSRDEIGIVSRLLGDMAAGLKSAQDLWTENQARKHDLDIAKEIQENLLPKHVPRIAGYDVSAYYSSAKEVGGDYYDFFLVDKTHLGMICADVSGKGIPGSMVMMMAKALITYEAENNLSPRDIFVKVNRTLAKDIKRGMFVTAFYMLLDIPTARLTVASAGHNPLLHYRAATKQCVEVNPGGIALGFDKDGRLFERNMKEETIQLQRGDRVVIYTDGVTEAMSPNNEEFGEERLVAITTQSANLASTPYLTALVNALQAHAQSDEQHDDITIVTLKVG